MVWYMCTFSLGKWSNPIFDNQQWVTDHKHSKHVKIFMSEAKADGQNINLMTAHRGDASAPNYDAWVFNPEFVTFAKFGNVLSYRIENVKYKFGKETVNMGGRKDMQVTYITNE